MTTDAIQVLILELQDWARSQPGRAAAAVKVLEKQIPKGGA